jgi:hypothetical protein
MKTVGYFDGTDSSLLTEIVARGHCTIPLANDFDGAGKNAHHIEPGDVDLIIGYLHKLVPPMKKEKPSKPTRMGEYRGLKPVDLLYPAKVYQIPVLVIVPTAHHKDAKKVLGDAADFVTLVSPEELEKKVLEHLK